MINLTQEQKCQQIARVVEEEGLRDKIYLYDDFSNYSISYSVAFKITKNNIEPIPVDPPRITYLLPIQLKEVHEDYLNAIKAASPTFFNKLIIRGECDTTINLLSNFAKLYKKQGEKMGYKAQEKDIKVKSKDFVKNLEESKNEMELRIILGSSDEVDFQRASSYYDFYIYINDINDNKYEHCKEEDDKLFKIYLQLFKNVDFYSGAKLGIKLCQIENVISYHKALEVCKNKGLTRPVLSDFEFTTLKQVDNEILVILFFNPSKIDDCIGLKKVLVEFSKNKELWEKNNIRLVIFGGCIEDLTRIEFLCEEMKIDLSPYEFYLKSTKNQNIIRKNFESRYSDLNVAIYDSFGKLSIKATGFSFSKNLSECLNSIIDKREKADKLLPILTYYGDSKKEKISQKNQNFIDSGDNFRNKKDYLVISPANGLYTMPLIELMTCFYSNYLTVEDFGTSDYNIYFEFSIEKYIDFDENMEIEGESWKRVKLDYKARKKEKELIENYVAGLNLYDFIPSNILKVSGVEVSMKTISNFTQCFECDAKRNNNEQQFYCPICNIYFCKSCGEYPNKKSKDYFVHKHGLLVVIKGGFDSTEVEERLLPKLEYTEVLVNSLKGKGKDLYAECSGCEKSTFNVRYVCLSCPFEQNGETDLSFTDYCQVCYDLICSNNASGKKNKKILTKIQNSGHEASHLMARIFDCKSYEKY